MIARSIGQTTAYLVAAPDYLERRPALTHPRDLEQHDCIVYQHWGREEVWWFSGQGTDSEKPKAEIAVTVHGRFRAKNACAVYRATLDGQGIALMSHLLVTDDIRTGRFRHVLPEFPSRRFPL
jgi:DNA-binding transcriptional LysR family regulator